MNFDPKIEECIRNPFKVLSLKGQERAAMLELLHRFRDGLQELNLASSENWFENFKGRK